MLIPFTESHVVEAAKPTERDLLEARAVILNELGAAPSRSPEELKKVLTRARGLPDKKGGARETVEIATKEDGSKMVNDNDPTLLRLRLERAIDELLGLLSADGLIMRSLGGLYGPAHIAIYTKEPGDYGNSGPSFNYFPNTPTFATTGDDSQWRLVRSQRGEGQVLVSMQLANDMEGFISERGVSTFREAIRCYQQGLYMAAVNMLAATSEAAWVAVALEVKDDSALAIELSGQERISVIIDKSTDAMFRHKVLRSEINSLKSHAHHLRDLRNYGLHPSGDVSEERKGAFTEAGASNLFMMCRGYFSNLKLAFAELKAQKADT